MPPLKVNKAITDLTFDNRRIVGGELFIAIPGFNTDGRDYIADACKRGAMAVLAEGEGDYPLPVSCMDAPVIRVDNLQKRVGVLANRYYRQPSEDVKVIGVTGTNGKTSCCWFISQIMEKLGVSCAVMGTVGKGIPGRLSSSLNTTADVLSTHAFLAELVEQQVSSLAMEVSSHGLDQGRVDGVFFEVALFTHISRDHLDYHGSLEAYAQAKARLFSHGQYHHAVIGKDDDFYELMRSACNDQSKVVTWSLEDASADVYASDIKVLHQGFKAQVHTPWGQGEMNTSQLGRFSLENLLAVIASLGIQGFDIQAVLDIVPTLETVPGRMQRFGGGDQPLVLVDYAHTPDAINSVLTALREHGAARLGCIYGCGGDRDRGKRPLMTKAALSGADFVVLTSDNPRSESPQMIIDDALMGIDSTDQKRLTIVVDRAQAIASTIATAKSGDILVVAGKGHEDYQEVHGKRHYFDDREQVREALSNWGQT
ncbi:UDP-N-acetylmuramoyl-L-alanyl-D-glutamate--2,6-diaminopimelate ligase [Endozoicomonas sp. (ex Bugula neritina AB1)]|nr:UDP-N-acetylmuramoyl-L-alanyl-D-glutamate--2,6-diaminopimelate ligase [Endozoicomonas sp. (ex Bugula neritina AB1)]